MTIEQQRAILKAFASLCYYYHKQAVPDAVLAVYVADVEDLPFEEVRAAMHTLRRDPRRTKMPLPAEIRAHIAPETTHDPEGQANQIAGSIVAAVGAIGYQQPAKAREKLGELAWQVVVAKGGWREICTNLQAADTGFFAQCRDIARSLLHSKTLYKAINVLPSAAPHSIDEPVNHAGLTGEKHNDDA